MSEEKLTAELRFQPATELGAQWEPTGMLVTEQFNEPYDMRVTGRELRIVNGDYRPDPDHIGPPVINAWIRFKDAPKEPYLHAALLDPFGDWGDADCARAPDVTSVAARLLAARGGSA